MRPRCSRLAVAMLSPCCRRALAMLSPFLRHAHAQLWRSSRDSHKALTVQVGEHNGGMRLTNNGPSPASTRVECATCEKCLA